MKFVFVFLSVFAFYMQINAQSFSGKIISAANKTPIANASIYFNNTSLGTVSNAEGEFSFSNLPSSEQLLIISCVGYETFQYTITPNNIGKILVFELKMKATELEEVRVLSFEKDGWNKWGKFFLDNFIGTSAEALDCKLLNQTAVKFSHNKKEGRLIVVAREPLEIVNKALGYKIRYDLEGFEYNFKERLLFFYGYQFYTEIDANTRKQSKWHKKRMKVYTGSMMHFMRSLYTNTLQQEGFLVNRMHKVPNYEKQRIQKIMRQRLIGNSDNVIVLGNGLLLKDKTDSSSYYNEIMRQPSEYAYLINTPLTSDSLVQKTDSGFVRLSFPNYLVISNKNKKFPAEYLQYNFSEKYTTNNEVISHMFMYTPTPIKVYASGNYIMPTNLISNLYWSWSEKIANLLPFNFEPK
jgi:hypothetical protein